MTKEEKYSLAKWAMQHALNNGAQQASVSILDSNSNDIEVLDEKIDKLKQSIESGLSIKLYVDNKFSSHSTNRLKKEELTRFIEQAIEGTKYLSEDEFRKLPDPELYYKGGGKDLKTTDKSFTDVEPQEKIEAVFKLEKDILGADERIVSITTSYWDGISSRVMVASNGFEGDYSSTHFGLGASVSVKDGEAKPSGGWYDTAVNYKDLDKDNTSKIALERALQKIGQEKIRTEKLPMLVENRTLGRILGPIISALNGSAIQQKNSFLIDKKGEKVLSDKLTIVDDPFILGGRGSKLFDGEGLAMKKRNIFNKGVLETYYIDTYYANKMEVEPTTGGTSNLIIEPGTDDLEMIISGLKRGILVTGFNGGNCNGTTGDYSYGVEGFLIENGKRTQPISEMNITGNMVDLWANVAAVGSDTHKNSSWRVPSVLFDGVDFSGI